MGFRRIVEDIEMIDDLIVCLAVGGKEILKWFTELLTFGSETFGNAPGGGGGGSQGVNFDSIAKSEHSFERD